MNGVCWIVFCLSLVIFSREILGYCATCEQNNNFMNLMNSIRAGNNNGNGNFGNSNNNNFGNGYLGGSSSGYGSTNGGIGSGSGNNFNLIEGGGYTGSNNNNGGSQWSTAQNVYSGNNFGGSNGLTSAGSSFGSNGMSNTGGSNTYGMNTFSTNNNNNNHNFNGIPVRIFTTGGGYGCCNMNTYGPCCQPQNFNSFLPNHSSFGGIQATPSNDVPSTAAASMPHASYSPSSSSTSTATQQQYPQPQQSPPIYDYTNTVQNNIPFTPQPKQQQNDAPNTITSATFDFFPQQHLSNNQYSTPTAFQNQQQQQTQDSSSPYYYKNPYAASPY